MLYIKRIVESIHDFSLVLKWFGMKEQQKIILMFPNCADYIVAFFPSFTVMLLFLQTDNHFLTSLLLRSSLYLEGEV